MIEVREPVPASVEVRRRSGDRGDGGGVFFGAASTSAEGRGERVLIVDDDPDPLDSLAVTFV